MGTVERLNYVSANSNLVVYGQMKNKKLTLWKFLFDDLQSKFPPTSTAPSSSNVDATHEELE